jgi:hypothetical protein
VSALRLILGLLLMAAAIAGCFFLATVGAGLAGANPTLFLPPFLMFWGVARSFSVGFT